MAGKDLEVAKAERLDIKKDGRGLVFSSDDENLLYDTSNYKAIFPSGVGESNPATGYLRIRIVSGSTYGVSGASMYIPFYANKA
jgi:hypothetical protein